MIYEKSNIREIINSVVQLMQIKAEKKNIILETFVDKDIPLEFCTEPRRLK